MYVKLKKVYQLIWLIELLIVSPEKLLFCRCGFTIPRV